MSTILDLQKKNSQHGREMDERKIPPAWLCAESDRRLRVHMVGLGDVGQNVATGLTTLGGERISRLGLYDLNAGQCARIETELGQIASPFTGRSFPEIAILDAHTLFDCDVFLFCATRFVPEVGSGVEDVRMAQYEANRGIVADYARQAARAHFTGLFVVVSDPVDLLCMAALQASAQEEAPLAVNQIQGCGLGVMHARAMYYAKRDCRFAGYLTEGRAFGPHGKDLVIANSVVPEHYDHARSLELTELTVKANLEVRKLGYKPYIAPAFSSAVFTILAILEGEWNYSAAYLNGIFFGAKNRTTREGIEWEILSLPDPLFERLQAAYQNLEAVIWKG